MSLRPGCELRCPGCSHRELTAEASALTKSRWLEGTLSRWAPRLMPIRTIQAERRWSYRDKICLRTEWSEDSRRWRIGLRVRKPGSLRDTEVVAIPDCPIHTERARGIVRGLSELLKRDTTTLPLAFVVISGALVTLVFKCKRLDPEIEAELKSLPWSAWGVQGSWLNFNAAAGNRVLASNGWRLLWGQERATVVLGKREMTYGPDSFQQLLPELYLDALREAAQFLAPTQADSVVDLCSGSGATLAMWRDTGARVLGVELGGESVRCAEINAGPGLSLRGKCSERLPQLQEWLEQRADRETLIFANPPRLGLETPVVAWIGEEAPARIAYLSCSAGTLARDLGQLEQSGYAVEALIPFDFFPQTPHVETLALLRRSK